MIIRQCLTGLLFASCAFAAQAELVVVTHPSTSASSIGLSQLSRIFQGQTSTFADGSKAVPLDVSESRPQFYREMLSKDPSQMEKYWTKMIFTGKAQPPRDVKSSDIKSAVADTKGAISYMDRSRVDGSVKVLKVDAAQ